MVLDKNRNVVGKTSQLDVLATLEPKYKEMGDIQHLSRAGFSLNFIKSMLGKYALCEIPLSNMCSWAGNVNVKEFMYSPTQQG